MARTPPYSTTGRMRSGLWLITDSKGQALLVNRSHLPAQGTGYKYYWVGGNQSQVQSRMSGALSALNVQPGNISNLGASVGTAFRKGYAPVAKPPGGLANWISNNWPFLLAAGAGGGALADASAGDAGAGDTSGDTTGDSGSSDTGASDTSGGGGKLGLGGAAGLAGATAFAVSDPVDFLKLVAWIFHPRNILRAAEFLTGIVVIIFGFNAAMQSRSERAEGFVTSEGALTRSGLGRVASELGAAARREGGGQSGRKPRRPRSAPHATRRRALRQRYQREEDLSRRRTKASRSKRKAP